MGTTKFYLMMLLVAVASLIYIYGVGLACYYTISKKFDGQNKLILIPIFVQQSINLIGGVLATNFGAFIGIAIDPAGGKSDGDGKAIGFVSLFLGLLENYPPQATASCVYMLGLTVCLVVWLLRNFEENPTIVVPILPQMSRTLLGAAVGALIVLLAK